MTRKFILFIVLIYYWSTQVFSQVDERGVKNLQPGENTSSSQSSNDTPVPRTGNVRAIIIGISNYKSLPENLQLKYADDDAQALHNYLLSRPDLVKPENITALFNDKATNFPLIQSRVSTILNKESQPGDLVIIYFAGHGILHANKGTPDEGFLLLHNASLDGDFFDITADLINLSLLKYYISMSNKDIAVLLITDACHSGKLVDSPGQANNITMPWRDNVFTLTSCQKNESALESEQWGGGHGVFTYYLIYGLKGLADNNEDGILQFGELKKYIGNLVSSDTKYAQNPIAEGDSLNTIVPVDNTQKNTARIEFEQQSNRQNDLAMRGINTRSASKDEFFFNIPGKNRYLINRFSDLISMNILSSRDYTGASKIRKEEVIIGEPYFIKASPENVFSTASSAKDKIVAVGGKDKSIRLYDIKTKEKKGSLSTEGGGVRCMAFSPDDEYLASGDWWENKISIWDISKQELIKSFKAHDNDVNTLVFSNDGKYLASGGYDNTIKIWNTENWTLMKSFKNIHSGRVNAIQFLHDGIVSGGDDGKLIFTDIQSGKELHKSNFKSPVRDIKVTANQKQILVGVNAKKVAVINAEDFSEIKTYQLNIHDIDCLEADDEAQFLFIAGKAHELLVFNNQKGELIKKIPLKQGVTDLNINTRAELLTITTYDGTLTLLELKNLAPTISENAYSIYQELMEKPELSYLHERFTAHYTAALIAFTNTLLKPFINGEDKLPSKEDLSKGLYYISIAREINKYAEQQFENELTTREKLLQIFLTVANNEFDQLPKAINQLNEIINLTPEASYTHNTLSSLYRRLNELEKARKAVNVAASRIPYWTEPKANLGQVYFAGFEFDKAIAEFNQIVTLQPDIPKGYKYLGDIYTYLGTFDEANNNYNKALSLDPENPYLLIRKAKLLIKSGQPEEAEKLIKKCLTLDPSFIEAYILSAKLTFYTVKVKGEGYQRTNASIQKLIESYNLFMKAWELDSTNTELQTELGMLLSTLYEYRKFHLKYFTDNFLSGQSSFKNDYEMIFKARKLFSSAMKANPFDCKNYAGLSYCKVLRKDNSKATEYLDEAIKKLPDSPEPYYYYADYLIKTGKAKKARKYLTKSLEKSNRYLPAHYLLLKTYEEGSIPFSTILNKALESTKSPVFENKNIGKYAYIEYM